MTTTPALTYLEVNNSDRFKALIMPIDDSIRPYLAIYTREEMQRLGITHVCAMVEKSAAWLQANAKPEAFEDIVRFATKYGFELGRPFTRQLEQMLQAFCGVDVIQVKSGHGEQVDESQFIYWLAIATTTVQQATILMIIDQKMTLDQALADECTDLFDRLIADLRGRRFDKLFTRVGGVPREKTGLVHFTKLVIAQTTTFLPAEHEKARMVREHLQRRLTQLAAAS